MVLVSRMRSRTSFTIYSAALERHGSGTKKKLRPLARAEKQLMRRKIVAERQRRQTEEPSLLLQRGALRSPRSQAVDPTRLTEQQKKEPHSSNNRPSSAWPSAWRHLGLGLQHAPLLAEAKQLLSAQSVKRRSAKIVSSKPKQRMRGGSRRGETAAQRTEREKKERED